MSLFSWSDTSIKQKIGGLFVFLLSFMLCLIVFSVYKIKQIEKEMSVVAYIDMPLSQWIRQVEFIELEQHLRLEQYQLEKAAKNSTESQYQQFIFEKQKVKKLLDKAISLINHSLSENKVYLQPEAHQKVTHAIKRYAQKSDQFERLLDTIYKQDSFTDQERIDVEKIADELEDAQKKIIFELNQLASDDANYINQHENDLLLIGAFLVLCALLIGLGLTIYIVKVIMTRITRIKSNVDTLNTSFEQQELPINLPNHVNSKDELATLEYDINIAISRLNHERTSHKKFEQELLFLLTQDKLTGAYNRYKWDEQIKNQINLAENGEYQFSLIILDVDYFKQVNDNHGHQVGDQLLQCLVTQIQRQIRKTDLLFRIGGEEFAIIAPMLTSEQAKQLANKIKQNINDLHEKGIPKFTISLGITDYQSDDTSECIFKRADDALYKAKAQGRNCIIVA